MKFSVITLFPEMLETLLHSSMMGRALSRGLFALDLIQLRDFADNSYGRIDDTLAGGGTGMLIQCEPVQRAVDYVEKNSAGGSRKIRKIFLSPKGRVLNQSYVQELGREEEILLLCGHYEGVDQRVLEANDFEELSLGDFVLTGGEYAAAVVIDAVARLIPGVLPNSEAYSQESHYDGLLEAKQYTRPAVWRGIPTPEVLLGGNHREIARWQRLSSLGETLQKRPDLFDRLRISAQEYAALLRFLSNGE